MLLANIWEAFLLVPQAGHQIHDLTPFSIASGFSSRKGSGAGCCLGWAPSALLTHPQRKREKQLWAWMLTYRRKERKGGEGCRILWCGTGKGKCFKGCNMPRHCRRWRSWHLWLAEGRGFQGSGNCSLILKPHSPE